MATTQFCQFTEVPLDQGADAIHLWFGAKSPISENQLLRTNGDPNPLCLTSRRYSFSKCILSSSKDHENERFNR